MLWVIDSKTDVITLCSNLLHGNGNLPLPELAITSILESITRSTILSNHVVYFLPTAQLKNSVLESTREVGPMGLPPLAPAPLV